MMKNKVRRTGRSFRFLSDKELTISRRIEILEQELLTLGHIQRLEAKRSYRGSRPRQRDREDQAGAGP
jgi:hypothetical protein